jgi:hypothetical protein
MMLGKDTNASLSADADRIARVLSAGASKLFTIGDAAKVLGIRECDLLRRIVSGEVEAVRARGDVAVPWAEVVSIGLETWPGEALDEALLSVDAPVLLRSAPMNVRLPRLLIAALECEARREGRTVSAVLAAELRDYVSAHSEWLSREVPGFSEALLWPHHAD